MKQEDIYITLIKFGRENHSRGFTADEIKNFIKKNEINITDSLLSRMRADIFQQIGGAETTKYSLKLDSYFHLLEYEELQEARKSSKAAHWTAIIAIFLSAVSLIVSICFTLYQISNPTTVLIEKKQAYKLKRFLFNLNTKPRAEFIKQSNQE